MCLKYLPYCVLQSSTNFVNRYCRSLTSRMQLGFPNSLIWNINHNYKYSQPASVRLCRQICTQLTTPNHSTQNILHCSLNVPSLHYELRRPRVPPKPEILANPKTSWIMSLANANRKHGLPIINNGHGLQISTTGKTIGRRQYSSCWSVHHGSQEIHDQSPGNPWIHVCNGYCKVYLYFIKRITFC